MEIAIEGLEVFAHHGVAAEERATGGRYVLDVTLILDSCPAVESDALEDTVDYAAVVDLVARVVRGSRFRLLERVAGAVAGEVLAAFPVDRVRVRAAKPNPPLDAIVARTAVTVEVSRPRR